MRFLFVDSISASSPGERIKGVKQIRFEDHYIYHNDENKAYFAPSLIGEAIGQLAAWNVIAYKDYKVRPVAGVVHSACLFAPAFVGEILELEAYIEHLDENAVQYYGNARVGKKIIFSIEGALGPLLPMDDFIEQGVVRNQLEAISKPFNLSLNTTSNLSNNASFPNSELLFDTITDGELGLSLKAEKRIAPQALYFQDHFPKKPVLPMTILLECKLNLANEFLKRADFKKAYKVSELRKIKMNTFINPGDTVICQLKVKEKNDEQLILSYRSEVNNKRVCVLEMVLISQDKYHA